MIRMEEVKERKQTKGVCPNCGQDTHESTFREEGEEIPCRKCKICLWWGR